LYGSQECIQEVCTPKEYTFVLLFQEQGIKLLTQQIIPIIQHILFQAQGVCVAKEEVNYAVISQGYIFSVM
jgi:hypothetical protein